MINPTAIMSDDILHLKNFSPYIFDTTTRYTKKTLLTIEINRVPNMPFVWDQMEIYKARSSL